MPLRKAHACHPPCGTVFEQLVQRLPWAGPVPHHRPWSSSKPRGGPRACSWWSSLLCPHASRDRAGEALKTRPPEPLYRPLGPNGDPEISECLPEASLPPHRNPLGRQGLTFWGEKGPERGARSHGGVSPRPAARGAGPVHQTRGQCGVLPQPPPLPGSLAKDPLEGLLAGTARHWSKRPLKQDTPGSGRDLCGRDLCHRRGPAAVDGLGSYLSSVWADGRGGHLSPPPSAPPFWFLHPSQLPKAPRHGC